MTHREIKFRAWHDDFGDMVYADMNNILYEKREFMMMFDVGFSNYPESGWKIMQFTGLKDSAGVDVYEDDILKYWGGVRPIVFHRSAFMIEYTKKDYFDISFEREKDIEIVGNIHQNPELLK